MSAPMPKDFGKIAVLCGGDSAERPVSLDSGRAVNAALRAAGVDAQCFDPAEQDLASIHTQGFAAAWNALHGGAGEDGTVQGMLDMLGVPYTGSGVLGSALAMDKVRSKAVLRDAGVAVPGGIVLRRGETPPVDIDFPVFVKPVNGGSSLGSTPVADVQSLPAALHSAFELDSTALVEPHLAGPEYTVGVLHDQALPVIRIDAGNAFYDYDAKYVSDATRFTCPALDDDPALAASLATLALRSFAALGCCGWGRVDFMCAADGTPYVLEVNTVPGMTDHSLVPCAARAAGIDFEQLCVRILQLALISQREGR